MILIEQDIIYRIVVCIPIYNNTAQITAVRKGTAADLLHAFGDRHAGQAAAAQECVPFDTCQVFGQSQTACKTSAENKRRTTNASQVFRKHQAARKSVALRKSVGADACQAFRKRQAARKSASVKSKLTYVRDALLKHQLLRGIGIPRC